MLNDLLDNDLLSDRFKKIVKNIIEIDGPEKFNLPRQTDLRLREVEEFIRKWFEEPSDDDLTVTDD